MYSKHEKLLILFICILANPLGKLLIEIYLPALPLIPASFNTSEADSQLSLTIYLIFFGLGLPFYGITSDYIGRKKLLMLGFILALSGTLMSVFANSISVFLIGRAFQGIGACAVGAIVFPILIDVFSEKQLIHAFIYADIAYTSVPIFAPFVGGCILLFMSWRMIFVLVSIYILVLIILSLFFLPETNMRKTKKFSVSCLCVDLKIIMTNRDYIYNSILIILSWSTIVVFNTSGPFLFQNIFGYTPYQFGIISLIFFILSVYGIKSPYIVLFFICISSALPIGIVWANSFALALRKLPDKSGFATSVLISMLFIFLAAISYIVLKFRYTQLTLSAFITLIIFVAFIIGLRYFLSGRVKV